MLKSRMASCLWWKFNIHVQCPGTELLYNPRKRAQGRTESFSGVIRQWWISVLFPGEPGEVWGRLEVCALCTEVLLRPSALQSFCHLAPLGLGQKGCCYCYCACSVQPFLQQCEIHTGSTGPSLYGEIHGLVLHLHCRNNNAGIWGTKRANPDFQHKSIC